VIKLVDLLALAGVQLRDFNIHCATVSPDGSSPLTAFLGGNFKGWQEWQKKRNFKCPRILSLIKLPTGRWLFAGVYEVHGPPKFVQAQKPHYEYSTNEVTGLDDLTGRVIVSFDRPGRAPYLRGKRYGDKLLVDHIMPVRYSFKIFPGFKLVLLMQSELRLIVSRGLESWRAALSSVAGIYLITDRSCGRHYVGSACGSGGIWARWCAYANGLHGGNRDLAELLSEKGAAHADNFQYSILEILSPIESPNIVLERESFWKEALDSRLHGYNKN
jgi:hypothetical protein